MHTHTCALLQYICTYTPPHTLTTHTHTHTHTHTYVVKHTDLPVVENYQQGGTAAAAANGGPAPEENGSHDHTDLEEVTAEEYITIESYQADGPGQVSFKEGEKVHVLEKLEDGNIIN